jgi:hypothetical protein
MAFEFSKGKEIVTEKQAAGFDFTGGKLVPKPAPQTWDQQLGGIGKRLSGLFGGAEIGRFLGQQAAKLTPEARRFRERDPQLAERALEVEGRPQELIPDIVGALLSLGGAGRAIPTVLRAAPTATRVATAVPRFLGGALGSLLFGGKGQRAISGAYKAPATQKAFMTGKQTLQTLAEEINPAIRKLRETSHKTYQRASAKLKPTALNKPETVKEAINVITETLGTTVKKGRVDTSLLGLAPQEERIIQSLYKLVSQLQTRRKVTTRDLLRLRQQIGKTGLYKSSPTANVPTSNRAVHAVTTHLNDVINKTSSVFKKATAKASKDINFLQQLGLDVKGKSKSVEATVNKLKALLSTIHEPGERAATKKLIAELEKRAGIKVLSKLESAATAKELTKDLPGAIGAPLQAAGALLGRGTAWLGRGAGTVTRERAAQFLEKPRTLPGGFDALTRFLRRR